MSSSRPSSPRRSGAWGLSGILAAAAALGVAELLAGLLPDAPSLLVAVGEAFIARVPAWLERLAIAVFATSDKAALVAGMLLVAAGGGWVLGVLGAHRLTAAAAGFAAFALLGVAAGVAVPDAAVDQVLLVATAAALTGTVVLRMLLAATFPALPAPTAQEEPGGQDRRRFLRLAAATGLAAAVSAVTGRLLSQGADVQAARDAVALPTPADPLPPTTTASPPVAGLSPLFTPNAAFYRIDTALAVPRVDPLDWRLQVAGMVDRPFAVTYDDVLSMAQVEADITLACVSNEVGGGLVGNARWLGVPLRRLLERAGVQPGATQVVGRSVDGWTAGFPTALALDGRDALVAVAMNGQPLPLEHGFPARLVVPGLYGYVSATKWLAEIWLTTMEGFDAYWVPRGWAKQAPVKTASRIDVPRHAATVTAGATAVAGVAWAPHRGIERVEVQVDDGPWRQARLSMGLGPDAWRQWVHTWQATPGPHQLRVRATDGLGRMQTRRRRPPRPDGASGWHTISVTVEPG